MCLALLVVQGATAGRPLLFTGASFGRNLTAVAPGCSQSCCYNPTWWLDGVGPPEVTCLDGSNDPGFSVDDLLHACDVGQFSDNPNCIVSDCVGHECVGIETCTPPSATCNYEEYPGDRLDPAMLPCTSIDFNGESQLVYSADNFKAGNNEIVWACADKDAPEGGAAGVSACGPTGAEYTEGSTFTKGSGFSVGGGLTATLFGIVELGVTGEYTQTTGRETTAGVTLAVDPGQHGCVTKGTLVHHTLGDLYVDAPDMADGCKRWKIGNWAGDMVVSDVNNPDMATAAQWGVEVKPCGYPLMNGAT